jgi:hypothetical protein
MEHEAGLEVCGKIIRESVEKPKINHVEARGGDVEEGGGPAVGWSDEDGTNEDKYETHAKRVRRREGAGGEEKVGEDEDGHETH